MGNSAEWPLGKLLAYGDNVEKQVNEALGPICEQRMR